MRVDINDREVVVVERNLILLLLALHATDNLGTDKAKLKEAADMMIHVWYSAFITKDMWESLQSTVGMLLKEVECQLEKATTDQRVEKVWEFQGGSSLRAVLDAEQWKGLLGSLVCPLSRDAAVKTRHAVTLASSRADFRDRWYFNMHTPFMRAVNQNFRKDGIVLPFGRSRDGFDVPNPYVPNSIALCTEKGLTLC